MRFVFLALTFSLNLHANTCNPNEIYIREQFINTYKKDDGTEVKEHTRAAHCRKIDYQNYIQDNSSQKFDSLNIIIAPWESSEKKLIETTRESLPQWIKKYKLNEILRAKHKDKNSKNPAFCVPKTRTIILTDQFFTSPNKPSILIHELAHIAVFDLTPQEALEFAILSGWTFKQNNFEKLPPSNPLQQDSIHSISEDYANHIEEYYSSPLRLKKFNPLIYKFIENYISKKEHK